MNLPALAATIADETTSRYAFDYTRLLGVSELAENVKTNTEDILKVLEKHFEAEKPAPVAASDPAVGAVLRRESSACDTIMDHVVNGRQDEAVNFLHDYVGNEVYRFQKLATENAELREALVSIEEYWNGNRWSAVAAAEEMTAQASAALSPVSPPATGADCTEPNRAACPRLCKDFCNEAEERKAKERDLAAKLSALDKFDEESRKVNLMVGPKVKDAGWIKCSERLPSLDESHAGIWVVTRPAPRNNGDQDPDWVALIRTAHRTIWTPGIRELAWMPAQVPAAPQPPEAV